MIDIGANLANRQFKSDYKEVLASAKAHGVEHIVLTGTDVATSKLVADLALEDPSYLSSTAGVHPHDADGVTAGWEAELRNVHEAEVVRAIGETGLDFYRNFSKRDNQIRVFEAQLEMARELGKPVFVHDRDSEGEVLRLLQTYSDVDRIVHCFTGSRQLLQRYLACGCYIGITGWICDERRGKDLFDSAPLIPDDRLLIETDSPYLIPRTIAPRPKSHRNEPANLKYVAAMLANARATTVDAIKATTTANARKLFGLQ